MNNRTKIKISDLNLSIGRNHILKNINLEIPENQVTVILGPSGCGKTTLMKCMNRLTDLYPDVHITGDIRIGSDSIFHNGHDITMLRKKMGLLSQRPYPLPMNIYNNVAFGLRIHGLRDKKLQFEKVQQYLKQVSLWDEVKDRLKDSAMTLSIGQQQRLCLARGLAVDPEIILADEPTSALDPISSMAIEKKFTELKSQYTIVLVTHILRQATRIADNVVFMYLGEVVEQGPADLVFNSPKEERTKAYLRGAFN